MQLMLTGSDVNQYWDVSAMTCAAIEDPCTKLDYYVGDGQVVSFGKCVVCVCPPLEFNMYGPEWE
ncbi:MAG: hypothetical protein IPK72_09495 [Candidatus Eisenbacteria bacterium]|nr:hypothetical protein [Candidatus Eisenbacteria bacterium]